MGITQTNETGPKDSPDEIISAIDVVDDDFDGYVTAPLSVLATRKLQIVSLLPGDWRFVNRVSVVIDKGSGRLAIDTFDEMPTETVKKKSDLERFPALVRVMKSVGDRAVSGFLIDFRRITNPHYENLGLTDGVGSAEFMERQTEYGAELPVGTIFTDMGKTNYRGDKDFRTSALRLAQEVDEFAQKLK